LLQKGLTISHQFLLYEDEDGIVWLLDKGDVICSCCHKRTPKENAQKVSPMTFPSTKSSWIADDKKDFPRGSGNIQKKYVRQNPNVITQQPLPKQNPPNPPEKEKEKPNCCKLCCIECGTCCVGLLHGT